MRTATIALGGGPHGGAGIPACPRRQECLRHLQVYALLNHFEAVGRSLEHNPLRAGLWRSHGRALSAFSSCQLSQALFQTP